VASATNLLNGSVLSCGCLIKEGNHKIHGHAGSRTHKIWKGIRYRCFHPIRNYGERGIKVCARWNKFENFLEDMGKAPEGLTIERLDVNGDYCKSNCQWVTRKVQNNNKRNNIHLSFQGETRTLAEWAERMNIDRVLLWLRIFRLKWPIERALLQPIRGHKMIKSDECLEALSVLSVTEESVLRRMPWLA